MGRKRTARQDLLTGTLDMLILKLHQVDRSDHPGLETSQSVNGSIVGVTAAP
jgi:hypothetical protein